MYQGKLLIAHPNLPSRSVFYKTVIYVYSHTETGTAGLILNTPSTRPLQDIFAENDFYLDRNKALYQGGPVGENVLIMLHSDDWNLSNHTQFVKNTGYALSSDLRMLHEISVHNEPAYWRMFVGLCGWDSGQLEAEISGKYPYGPEHSWLIADATDELIFGYSGKLQWEKALEKSSQQIVDQLFS